MAEKIREILLKFRYILRLPIVTLKTIFLEGLPAFRKKFKNWSHIVASGQLGYEINVRNNASTVSHKNILFAENVDFLTEIVRIHEDSSRSFEFDNDYPLDVVVPIYNAYEDFLMCLYSLLKHQDIYRIILIDDCSPDPRMLELLTTIKKYEQPTLRVEFNSQNLGFLNTVNKGMRMTQHDVILLNTDTVVTQGWARKMRACAYSNDHIATVTPFTNNGRMCSIPSFLQDNDLPKGFTVDSFAECVEKASINIYPELVVAVGFCMYIRRNAINDIGYFDDVNFGQGYGEEVDFSFRAINKGYKNVLCDNTFVYHKGKASFLDTQRALMDKNHIFLSEKYPEHWAAIAHFERTNPLKELHNKLNKEMKAG